MFCCQTTRVPQPCHSLLELPSLILPPLSSLSLYPLNNRDPSSVGLFAATSLKFPGSPLSLSFKPSQQLRRKLWCLPFQPYCMSLVVSDHFWLRPFPLNCAGPVLTMFRAPFAFTYSPRKFFALHQSVLRKNGW